MKQIIIISILLSLFISCKNDKKLDIVNQYKMLIDNDYCKIHFNYPIIRESALDSVTQADLNQALYTIPEYNYYLQRYDTTKMQRDVIHGDYDIILQNDSIISIEYLTVINQSQKTVSDSIYHSIVFKIDSNNQLIWGISPEYIIANFDRSSLKPYIEKYNLHADRKANLLAYESGSRYAITWALTNKTIIIYPAGEGEHFGFGKLIIPLINLK